MRTFARHNAMTYADLRRAYLTYVSSHQPEGFHSWVQTVYYRLFKCSILPDGRMISRIHE